MDPFNPILQIRVATDEYRDAYKAKKEFENKKPEEFLVVGKPEERDWLKANKEKWVAREGHIYINEKDIPPDLLALFKKNPGIIISQSEPDRPFGLK